MRDLGWYIVRSWRWDFYFAWHIQTLRDGGLSQHKFVLEPLTNISNWKTFLQDFVVILKRPLQNYFNILKNTTLRVMLYILCVARRERCKCSSLWILWLYIHNYFIVTINCFSTGPHEFQPSTIKHIFLTLVLNIYPSLTIHPFHNLMPWRELTIEARSSVLTYWLLL